MNKIARLVLVIFYFIAGVNHFLNPEFYIGLIPDYLPFPQLINYTSGFLEILFSILFIFQKTRKKASYGLILLLILFIPSHVYFINIGSCVANSLCVAPWISWTRLLIIHPLLILWVWWIGLKKNYG